MKASVIIPTYNRSQILNYTLSSLVEQDFPRNEYEVIVIDDGSSDNTREVVESFNNKLEITYYFQEDKGFRVALARNEGIKRAKGDVLIFIDTGIIVGSSFVREHYNIHNVEATGNYTDLKEKYAVIGYVFGFTENNKGEDALPEFADFNRPNEMIKKLKESSDFEDVREFVYSEINDDLTSIPTPWVLFFTNNVSVERSEIIKAGCFDEDFTTWGLEDTECAYKLFKNNLKFKLTREACGFHYPHERHNVHNRICWGINLRKFYNKHQDDEVELFTSGFTLEFIEEYKEYLKFREKLGKTPIYSSILTEDAAKFLSEEMSSLKNIVLGCQDGFLLDVCNSTAGTESDMDLILKARENHSDMEIHRSFGIRTPYKVNNFEASLVAGTGMLLNETYINRLVREAFRISKKVYWLKEHNGINITEYEYSEVKDLGNGIVLYQIGPKSNSSNACSNID